MKKALVVIAAVAILGTLAVYANGKKSDGYSSANSGRTSTTAANTSGSASSSSTAPSSYKDGTYTGDVADTPYGTVQVAAVISGGKITNIQFIKMPNDFGHTQEVTAMSEP